MSLHRALCAAPCLLCVRCSSDVAPPATTTLDAAESEVANPDAVRSVSLRVALQRNGEGVEFLTPGGTVEAFAAADLVGRPWVAGIFAGGAQVAVDEPLHREWGTVPESLEFTYAPPMLLEPGPYDLAAVIYVTTDVQEADKVGTPPFPRRDVSAFSFESTVLEGDEPPDQPALVRANLHDADVNLTVTNRVATSADTEEERVAASIDTLLFLP